jgi:hypothetical protein
VKVERMNGFVMVIHHNLDDVTFLHYKRIDHPIDQRICVLLSCANCCKERWYFLWNVSYVVEICPLSWLASWQDSSLGHTYLGMPRASNPKLKSNVIVLSGVPKRP